jgi:hypothetical protein
MLEVAEQLLAELALHVAKTRHAATSRITSFAANVVSRSVRKLT